MKIGSTGVDLIKHFESCKLTAYQDSVGIWTIGWGHTGSVKKGDIWTQGEADNILLNDLDKFEGYVNQYVKVPLTQNQFDALVSWTFNLGPGNLKSSTMLTKLNEKKYDEVPSQMKRWNKAGGKVLRGLERRRNAEAVMFSGEDWKEYFE